jgi:hypothetical protein
MTAGPGTFNEQGKREACRGPVGCASMKRAKLDLAESSGT